MSRILVVDEEKEIANLVHDVLDAEGYEAISIYNAKIALEQIKEKDFDLVITDLAMPEMNGIELFEAIQKLEKTMPVIAMTGNILDWNSDTLSKFNKVLTKPFSNIKEIVSAVKEVLTQPLSDNE